MTEPSNDTTWLHTVSTLGSAIVSWSHCEEATEHLLRDILMLHGLDDDAAHIVASSLDLRPRCALGVALAYKLDPPRDVIEQLSAAVNSVQNELRNTRNRLFHDSWMFKKGSFHKRATTGPKLSRPQARQLELAVPDYVPADIQEVSTFSQKCLDISDEIHTLLRTIEMPILEQRINKAKVDLATAEAMHAELVELLPRQRKGLIHRLRHIFGRR